MGVQILCAIRDLVRWISSESIGCPDALARLSCREAFLPKQSEGFPVVRPSGREAGWVFRIRDPNKHLR